MTKEVSPLPYSFFGGVHPYDNKSSTAQKEIEKLPAPPRVAIPMSVHIGAPCQPLVQKGDLIKLGQKIGEAAGSVSAPIHASVSGTVAAVEPRLHPNGNMVMSVIIDNDGLDTLDESVKPCVQSGNALNLDLPAIIRQAGIVGMGGAAFPTAFKITSGMGKLDTIIINAAECEPYITADHRIMLEKPEEVLTGIRLLTQACGLGAANLCIESNKKDAIKLFASLLGKEGGIKIITLKTKYPQGAEKQLVQTVTKRQIPAGGLPADVGCVVFNVSTAYAVYQAVYEGMPAISRVVTVAGSAVKEPKNLLIRVGTPLESVFSAAGGFSVPPCKIIMGGPMMGAAVSNLEMPVVKGTNALLAFAEANETAENQTCIRCGKCASVCPMKLMPLYLYMHEQKNDLAACEELHVKDCIECGACTYICPGRLYLTQSCRSAKARLMEKNARDKAEAERKKLEKAKEGAGE